MTIAASSAPMCRDATLSLLACRVEERRRVAEVCRIGVMVMPVWSVLCGSVRFCRQAYMMASPVSGGRWAFVASATRSISSYGPGSAAIRGN